MGKSGKKFVPPLKPSKNVNIDENGNHINKTGKLSKGKKKKLLVNFDYAQMKKRNATKKQAIILERVEEEECKVIEVDSDDPRTAQQHDVTSSEFMWFEPIQASQESVSKNRPRTSEGCESLNSQQQVNNCVEGSRQAADVYSFPSSPAEEQKDPDCVACHLEEAEEKQLRKKKKETMKTSEKSRKSSKKSSDRRIKKKVKKQVLKSLFKMGEDMAMLRAQEKALKHGGQREPSIEDDAFM